MEDHPLPNTVDGLLRVLIYRMEVSEAKLESLESIAIKLMIGIIVTLMTAIGSLLAVLLRIK